MLLRAIHQTRDEHRRVHPARASMQQHMDAHTRMRYVTCCWWGAAEIRHDWDVCLCALTGWAHSTALHSRRGADALTATLRGRTVRTVISLYIALYWMFQWRHVTPWHAPLGLLEVYHTQKDEDDLLKDEGGSLQRHAMPPGMCFCMLCPLACASACYAPWHVLLHAMPSGMCFCMLAWLT